MTDTHPRQWVITIPIAGEWLTSNNRLANPKAQGRRVKLLRGNAYVAALSTRPKLPTGLDLIQVDVLYRWGVKPVEEMANLSESLKACVDGALGRKRGTAPGYGVVVADSDRHLKYGSVDGEQMVLKPNQAPLAKFMGEVVLTITDLGGGS